MAPKLTGPKVRQQLFSPEIPGRPLDKDVRAFQVLDRCEPVGHASDLRPPIGNKFLGSVFGAEKATEQFDRRLGVANRIEAKIEIDDLYAGGGGLFLKAAIRG